jgi:hypothetical protein
MFLSDCDIVSVTKPLITFMEFTVGFPYSKLSDKGELSENRLSDRYALHNGTHEFVPILSAFLDWSW